MRNIITAAFIFMLFIGLSACGKDDASRAERDAEVQKKIQEGMQREKQLYEGMQKGSENIQKQMEEQSNKPGN
jgi:hypothetical protein